MKLNEFKNLLQAHPLKHFRLTLPNNDTVPVSFHITEVAYIQKRFIDCGGKVHNLESCQLQAWVYTDTNHRLLSGKMLNVLNLAKKILPESDDLELEIEYEASTISQYTVARFELTDDAVILMLESKHTDCLAKEFCLPSTLPMVAGSPKSCGCGSDGCC